MCVTNYADLIWSKEFVIGGICMSQIKCKLCGALLSKYYYGEQSEAIRQKAIHDCHVILGGYRPSPLNPIYHCNCCGTDYYKDMETSVFNLIIKYKKEILKKKKKKKE